MQRAEAFAVGHPLEHAGQVPGPAVVAALELAQSRTRTHAQRVAAMAAGILERAQYPVVAADDQHPVRAAAVLEIVTRLRDVVDHAGELPDLGPHPFDLERRERR